MNIDNINIISYTPNGDTILADTSTKWGNKILLLLKENLKANEDIKFSILTTRVDNIESRELYHIYTKDNGIRLDWFFCLTMLEDRLIIINVRVRSAKLLSLTDYDAYAETINFSTVDSVIINTNNNDTQYGVNIRTSIREKSITFGYKASYHPHIKPYLDKIEYALSQAKPNSDNFLNDLERLSKLKSQGILSEEEFIKAKKLLLK